MPYPMYAINCTRSDGTPGRHWVSKRRDFALSELNRAKIFSQRDKAGDRLRVINMQNPKIGSRLRIFELEKIKFDIQIKITKREL